MEVLAKIVYALLFIGFIFCLIVSLKRLASLLRTPQLYSISLSPIANPWKKRLCDFLLDWVLFRKLWVAMPILWPGSWLFHVCLLLLFFGHLKWLLLPELTTDTSMIAFYVGISMIGALCYLLVVRRTHQRMRYISRPADYAWLLLFLLIALSGVAMSSLLSTTDLVNIRLYIIHIDTDALTSAINSSQSVIDDLRKYYLLMLHLFFVAIAFVLFPMSKLIHGITPVTNPALKARHSKR